MSNQRKTIHISVKSQETKTIDELDRYLKILNVTRSQFFITQGKLFLKKNEKLLSTLEQVVS